MVWFYTNYWSELSLKSGPSCLQKLVRVVHKVVRVVLFPKLYHCGFYDMLNLLSITSSKSRDDWKSWVCEPVYIYKLLKYWATKWWCSSVSWVSDLRFLRQMSNVSFSNIRTSWKSDYFSDSSLGHIILISRRPHFALTP